PHRGGHPGVRGDPGGGSGQRLGAAQPRVRARAARRAALSTPETARGRRRTGDPARSLAADLFPISQSSLAWNCSGVTRWIAAPGGPSGEEAATTASSTNQPLPVLI